MYGGFVGVAFGALSLMAGWTSPYPGICTVQFATILGCGLGGGLVFAYGPRHSLAWLFGVGHRDATWKDFAKRVGLLFLVAVLCVALAATIWRPSARLEIFLFAWLVVLLLLMTAGPRACDTPMKHWGLACCDTLAAVYGPFVVAAIHTWWFDGSNTWWHAWFLKYALAVPGGVVIEGISAMIWHRHPDLSPTALFVFAGLLSATVVVGTMWLAAKTRQWRWGFLPFVGGLCAFGAFVLDAAMRA